MRTFLIVVFWLLCLPAFARIGETPEECEKRYGKHIVETSEGKGEFLRHYEKSGYMINVWFLQSGDTWKVEHISYYRKDENRFAKEEIRDLLQLNSKKGWKYIDAWSIYYSSKPESRRATLDHAIHYETWQSEDKTLWATYTKEAKSLSIRTEKMEAFVKKQIKKEMEGL